MPSVFDQGKATVEREELNHIEPFSAGPEDPLPGAVPNFVPPWLKTPVADATIEVDPRDDDEADQAIIDEERVIQGLPPILASFVFHLIMLIVIGLMVITRPAKKLLEYEAVFSEHLGDQLDNDRLELFALEEPEVEEPIFVPESTIPVEDPLAATPDLPLTLDRGMLSSDFQAPDIGFALEGRTEGMKELLRKTYGGTALTERAVEMALEWLKRNQRSNGSWSLVGPYSDGASEENHSAATAMALLAFQGAGHTHEKGTYQDVVKKGKTFLISQQGKTGGFYRGSDRHHRPYTQGMAMIAVCELFAMTRDEELHKPAQLAVDLAVKIQDAQGGWRYEPRDESDTSVTGWYLMGLQSARMAGLEVPRSVFDNVRRYLDLAATEYGARYGYLPGSFETPAMTAEGLLCRQYLGWKRDDSRMRNGVAYLLANPIDWSERNTYYWYYATQVLHNMEGYEWEEWNRVMREILPANQEQNGRERGSWARDGDRWGNYGGRLFVTCLSTYMLEVYYRHLPIYSPLYKETAD